MADYRSVRPSSPTHGLVDVNPPESAHSVPALYVIADRLDPGRKRNGQDKTRGAPKQVPEYHRDGGGTALMTAFSAKVDEHGQWFDTPQPGRLSDVFGLKTNAFYQLESPLKFALDVGTVDPARITIRCSSHQRPRFCRDSRIPLSALPRSPSITSAKGARFIWQPNRELPRSRASAIAPILN